MAPRGRRDAFVVGAVLWRRWPGLSKTNRASRIAHLTSKPRRAQQL
jgi:hypothetical protein